MIADLGLARSILSSFADVDLQGASPISTLWRRITGRLTPREAERLPHTLGEVIPLLMSSPARLRLALDLVATFDLVETLPTLLRLASQLATADLVQAAAWLATSPGSKPGVLAEVRRLAGSADLSPRQLRALEVRLSADEVPHGDLESSLQLQVWPGSSHVAPATAPSVAIDELAGSPELRLKVAGDLHEAGASLRRLPAEWSSNLEPRWLGRRTVVVAWTPAAITRIREIDPSVSTGQFVFGPSDERAGSRRKLLVEVDRALTDGPRLRLPEAAETDLVRSPLNPDIFQTGAFDLRDMLFLSSVSRSTLNRLREELRPQFTADTPYWSFSQLVALRTWQVLRLKTRRRHLRTDVVRTLSRFAGSSETRRIGVTTAGDILHEDDKVLVNLMSGQESIPDFIYLDEVFRPVELGGGRIPGLTEPSVHTRVNPAVLGGTPRAEGQRIAARTIAKMNLNHGMNAVIAAYPTVERAILDDAARVGAELLKAA